MYRLMHAPCHAVDDRAGRGQTAKSAGSGAGDALGFLLVKDLRQLSDKVEDLARKLKVEERVSLLELLQQGMASRTALNDKAARCSLS